MVLPNHQAKITDFVKKIYHDYFGVKLGDQDKPFAPHICCKTCMGNLRDWRNDKRKCMSFAIPMDWREGKDHITDCYFCMINLKGINHKNKHLVQYPNVSSTISPIPHSPDLPAPESNGNGIYLWICTLWYDCCRWEWCMHASQKRMTYQYPWHKQNSTTWHETWTFQRNLLSCWVHISKRNICWH